MCRFDYRLDTFPQGKTLLWGKPNSALTICYDLDAFVTPNPCVKEAPEILGDRAFEGDWVLMTELLWSGWSGWVRNIPQVGSDALPVGGSSRDGLVGNWTTGSLASPVDVSIGILSMTVLGKASLEGVITQVLVLTSLLLSCVLFLSPACSIFWLL